MQIRVVTKILGSLLILFSITMIPPLIVSLVYEDNELWSFIYAFFLYFYVCIILTFDLYGVVVVVITINYQCRVLYNYQSKL